MCTNSTCASSKNQFRKQIFCKDTLPVKPIRRYFFETKMVGGMGHTRKSLVVTIVVLLLWNLSNSTARASHQSFNGPFAVSTHPNSLSQRTISNVRMRAPQNLDTLTFGGAGITLSDEGSVGDPNPVVIRSSSPQTALVPFYISPQREHQRAIIPDAIELSGPKRKKDCGEPSIATRGLIGPSLKRSFFAFSEDEVKEKVKNDEYRQASERRKREIQHQQLSSALTKRNGGAVVTQDTDSPLPWTCETKYEWKDMGADHYPRFVRTAECKSRLCFNGFFRCRPRRYKTKVLKRITPSDSSSCEDDDVSLPEALRVQWRFKTVTINLCCDCSGRVPGTADV